MTDQCICGKECKATEHDYEPIDMLEIDCSVHGVQPTACMQCCFEAYRDGAEAERARIVAWLRERCHKGLEHVDGHAMPKACKLAEQIEEGAHNE